MVYKSSPCLGNGAHDIEIALNGKLKRECRLELDSWVWEGLKSWILKEKARGGQTMWHILTTFILNW